MWVVADVGGTNARFGLVDGPEAKPEAVHILDTSDFKTLTSATQTYLDIVDVPKISALCAAVAGPTGTDLVKLTNAEWSFSVNETANQLGVDRAAVLNDFQALALSVPHLPPEALLPIGQSSTAADDKKPTQNCVVVGAGTGLGTGMAVPHSTAYGTRWSSVAGEGGHVTLPALEEDEWAAMQVLKAEQGHVTAECFLCGSGLERLYRCHAQARGQSVSPLTAPEITKQALEGTDSLAVGTLEMFCAMLGSVTSNAALIAGARGGAFLGGGILPRFADFLNASEFRARFEANVRMTDFLKQIPTHLIISDTPALYGTAAWLSDWHTYGDA